VLTLTPAAGAAYCRHVSGPWSSETTRPVRIGIVGLVYLVVGLVVASNRDYLSGVDTLGEVVSALLAILLWPLLLLGVDVRIDA
jgi:hypothetical protein